MMCVARTVPNSSFYSVSRVTISQAQYIVNLAVAVKCFGVGTSYFIVVGDLMPPVLKEVIPNDRKAFQNWFVSRKLWITVFCALFIVPFVRFRAIDKLKFTSSVAIMCFACVVLVVLLYAYVDDLDGCAAYESNDDCKDHTNAVPEKQFAFMKVCVFNQCTQSVYDMCAV